MSIFKIQRTHQLSVHQIANLIWQATRSAAKLHMYVLWPDTAQTTSASADGVMFLSYCARWFVCVCRGWLPICCHGRGDQTALPPSPLYLSQVCHCADIRDMFFFFFGRADVAKSAVYVAAAIPSQSLSQGIIPSLQVKGSIRHFSSFFFFQLFHFTPTSDLIVSFNNASKMTGFLFRLLLLLLRPVRRPQSAG